jgi:hypothetical protein
VLNCATEAQETQEAAQDRRSRPPSSVLAIVNLESNSLSSLPVSILKRIPKEPSQYTVKKDGYRETTKQYSDSINPPVLRCFKRSLMTLPSYGTAAFSTLTGQQGWGTAYGEQMAGFEECP